jgi:hypothetical protein
VEAVGGGVFGLVKRGRFGAAANSAGVGAYLKKFYPPIPVTVGSECECKGKTGFGGALSAIVH